MNMKVCVIMCVYLCLRTSMYLCISYVCMYMCMSTYMRMLMCAPTCMCVCMCVRICVCMCVCMCVCVNRFGRHRCCAWPLMVMDGSLKSQRDDHVSKVVSLLRICCLRWMSMTQNCKRSLQTATPLKISFICHDYVNYVVGIKVKNFMV